MKYTKEQLLKALEFYYKKMHETPDDFYTAVYSDFKEDAKNTLDALIEILETK